MPEENRIIELLQENNSLLKQLLDIKKKERRDIMGGRILHLATTLIPFILILIAGYFAWIEINHYLEILNNNINTLKTNFDLLRDFFQKLIPDFGAINTKLMETWKTVKFWN